MILNLLKIDWLIDDTKADRGYEPLDGAILGHGFMTLHFCIRSFHISHILFTYMTL